jgi:hypothetical protein
VNEVESGTSRVARKAAGEVTWAWGRFTDLGQGAWLLVLGLGCVGVLVLAVVMGRGGASTCDQAFPMAHDIRIYDGNPSMQTDGVHQLLNDARGLDQLAGKASGPQRDALSALADVARHAHDNQPFRAASQLTRYDDVCS